jgi:NCS1 family nucleobase:cation symporter-1
MFSRTSLYGQWAWRGLVSYAAGLLAMAPFFVLPFYVGPGAQALGGVDISIVFGLPVAGLLYYYLARSLDLRLEEIAYETSLTALEQLLNKALPNA